MMGAVVMEGWCAVVMGWCSGDDGWHAVVMMDEYRIIWGW